MTALLSRREVRAIGLLAVFALVGLACARVAYPSMFGGIHPDDEGTGLLAFKTFLGGRSLYDDTFTYYGPFYYDFWGGIAWAFGVAVNHDNGRLATMGAWLAASLLGGLVSYRVTRSVLLGVCGQILVFGTLGSLATEPTHPAGLIVVLLLAMAGVAAWLHPRHPRLTMFLLGVGISALLTKINVAGFALLAVALACVATFPALAGRRLLRLAVEALFVAVPVVIMSQDLDQAWAQKYALVVAGAALAVVLALRQLAPQDDRRQRELASLAGGLLGATVLFFIPVLVTGSTPGGIWHGLVSEPLRQPGALQIPYAIPDTVVVANLIAIAAALAYRGALRAGLLDRPLWARVRPWLSIAAGVTIAVTAGRLLPGVSSVDRYLGELWPVGLAWVALVPTGATPADGLDLARRVIPPLAVLETLQAYPVAGSQIAFGAVLLIVVGALCVGNGVAELRASPGTLRRAALIAASVAAALALSYKLVRLDHRSAQDRYDAMVPLDLPGASRLRATAADAAVLHGLTRAIDRHCDTFLTLPGLNSLFFWTRKEPVDGLNWTHWWSLFDDATQQRVLEDARRVDRLCLVRYPVLARSLAGGSLPRPGGPLLQFERRAFTPLRDFGPYQLLRRSG